MAFFERRIINSSEEPSFGTGVAVTFCTMCGSPRNGSDPFCSGCGNKFDNAEATVIDELPGIEQVPASGGCPNGHHNESRAKFCTTCQLPIRIGDVTLSPEQRDWVEKFDKEMDEHRASDETWNQYFEELMRLARQFDNKIRLRGFEPDEIEDQWIDNKFDDLRSIIELCCLDVNCAMVALDLAVEGHTRLQIAAEALRASDWEPTLAWNVIVEQGWAKEFDWPPPTPPKALHCLNGHPIAVAFYCVECGAPVPYEDDGFRLDRKTRAANLQKVKAAIEQAKKYDRMAEKEKKPYRSQVGQMESYVLSKGYDFAASLAAGCFGGETAFGHRMSPCEILGLFNMDVYAFMRSFDLATDWDCQLFWTADYMTRNGGDRGLAWNELIKDRHVPSAKWVEIEESHFDDESSEPPGV